jgi:phosphoserine phosphatase RsbU/P
MGLALLLAALIALDEGWQFVVTEPRETPPPEEAAWRHDRDVHERGGRDLWYRNRLPRTLPREPHLVLRAYVGTFTLFVDGRPIYAFDDPAADRRLRVHVVALPSRAEGQLVYLRIPRATRSPFFSTPLIAAREDVPAALDRTSFDHLRDDLPHLIVGMLLLVIGLVAAGASQLLRRGDTRVLLWFGLFAALYGARILADSYLPRAAGMSVDLASYAGAWITYVITIPGWALARRLIGDGWRGSLRWQLAAFLLFAPTAIASDLILRRPESLETANNVLVIVGGLNVLFNLVRVGQRRSPDLRVILAGSVIFMLLALNNNLSALGILPWSDVDETVGFVAFVAALGYAATRSFLRGESARVALEGELATAREIQRSILPTAMPSLQRFRFDAHFDPASTVAGDLYDFLRVDDDRVGVLVADVSGHGVPAALIASMVKIAVSSQSRFAHDPGALLREVNRTLRGEVRRAFVTATYLFFDAVHATVEVANAGHPPPLLCRDRDVRELGPRGVLLGRFDATYAADKIALRRGDRIVAYTDGVIEARNGREEPFGEERLQELVRGGATSEEIARAVRAWRAGGSEADDVTLLVIDLVA